MSNGITCGRRQIESVVCGCERAARDTVRLTFSAPEFVFETFSPGQFAHIAVPSADTMLLRRPFSIYSVDRARGEVSVIFRIVGSGTADLARCAPGQRLNVLMPLGKGFRVDRSVKSIWLAGGGLGCAALGTVAETWPDIAVTAFFGFRTKEDVFSEKSMPKGLKELCRITEEGENGGFVTDIVSNRLSIAPPDLILACGPAAMYEALKKSIPKEIPVQISVEERMGCGTGGCETCVCMAEGVYRKTCTDGPVFDLDEVDEYAR